MTVNVRSSEICSASSSKNENSLGADCLVQVVQWICHRMGKRPKPRSVVEALVNTEKYCKQNRTQYPELALLGTWRFCFSANKQSRVTPHGIQGKGFYVPQWIKATLSLEREHTNNSLERKQASSDVLELTSPTLTVTNVLQLGAILLKLTGPAKYLDKKNLLAFDFHQLELMMFGARLYSGAFPGKRSTAENFEQKSIANLPFFAFVAVSDEYIAARGRGGGLALWTKLNE